MSVKGRLHIMPIYFMLFSFLLTLTGCAVSAVRPGDLPPDIPKLEKKYRKVICYPIQATAQVKEYYPEEVANMQNSMLEWLKSKGEFEMIRVSEPDEWTDKETLLVRIKVTDMNLVGFWKRGIVRWERSFIHVSLDLIDGETKDLLIGQRLKCQNDPRDAHRTFGATDRSLPGDMGKVIGEYIAQSMPERARHEKRPTVRQEI